MNDLLSLVSKPLQMLDSDWAMSYIVRLFAAIKTAKVIFQSADEKKDGKEFIN